jgi:Transglutaminase elicitor
VSAVVVPAIIEVDTVAQLERKCVIWVVSLLILWAVGGCVDEHHREPSEASRQWDAFNFPDHLAIGLGESLHRQLARLPLSGKVNQVPWSGHYWPDSAGGIASRWHMRESQDFRYRSPRRDEVDSYTVAQLAGLSPAEKLDILRDNFDFPTVRSEWARTKGPAEAWEGICDGVAVAALHYGEAHSVVVRSSAGIAIPFGTDDVKGLLAWHEFTGKRGKYRIAGTQCLMQDRTDAGACVQDVNAGTFHLLLGNFVGIHQRSVLMDVDPGPDVWNHAVIAYDSQIVASTSPSPSAAEGTVIEKQIHTRVMRTVIRKPQWEPVKLGQTDLDAYEEYDYRLELDSGGRIIGGEWVSENQPDVMWIAEKSRTPLDPVIQNLYQLAISQIPFPEPELGYLGSGSDSSGGTIDVRGTEPPPGAGAGIPDSPVPSHEHGPSGPGETGPVIVVVSPSPGSDGSASLPEVASSEERGNAQPAVASPDPAICPAGSVLRKLAGGGLVCQAGDSILGPFPHEMRVLCRKYGGGNACSGARWADKMVRGTWGPGRCPVGTRRVERGNGCTDGAFVYGPFTQSQIKRCEVSRSFGSEEAGQAECRNKVRWTLARFRSL